MSFKVDAYYYINYYCVMASLLKYVYTEILPSLSFYLKKHFNNTLALLTKG